VISNHPSAHLLRRYAGGDLALAPCVVVAAHIEVCKRCRNMVGDLTPPALEIPEGPVDRPPRALLARIMARLDEVDHATATSPRKLGDAPLPGVVRGYGLHPRRYMSPRIWLASLRLPPLDGWRAYILRAPPGFRIPRHEHRGAEVVQVLTGAFRDGSTFQSGDFIESIKGRVHSLTVTPDGPCASLIASQGGSRWAGLMTAAGPLLRL
jgi:putative transcriptional regulator